MKHDLSQGKVVFVLVVGVLLLAACWSVLRMRSNAATAAYEHQQLVECLELSKKILTLQGETLTTGEDSFGELKPRIQAAADSVKCPRGLIQDPNPPQLRRLDKTAYVQQRMAVKVRQITLPQLLKLLHHILVQNIELNVASIHLQAPSAKRTKTELWDSDLMLTTIAYSPDTRASD